MKGIYTNKNGKVSLIAGTQEALETMTIEKICMKNSPDGITPIIIHDSELPDNLFFDAWEIKDKKIEINIEKAKNICHKVRRQKREILFKPLDIEATIPIKAVKAEAKRQVIRNNDNKLQNYIDASKTEKQLKTIIEKTYQEINYEYRTLKGIY